MVSHPPVAGVWLLVYFLGISNSNDPTLGPLGIMEVEGPVVKSEGPSRVVYDVTILLGIIGCAIDMVWIWMVGMKLDSLVVEEKVHISLQ